MKNPILNIFNTCENERILCKAIRRSLHLSQRVMAKRLLTSQTYICCFETRPMYKDMSSTEHDRILYNLKIDFEETIVSIGQKIGKEQAYLTVMQVLIEYLRLSLGKGGKDREAVLRLLKRFQDEFRRL